MLQFKLPASDNESKNITDEDLELKLLQPVQSNTSFASILDLSGVDFTKDQLKRVVSILANSEFIISIKVDISSLSAEELEECHFLKLISKNKLLALDLISNPFSSEDDKIHNEFAQNKSLLFIENTGFTFREDRLRLDDTPHVISAQLVKSNDSISNLKTQFGNLESATSLINIAKLELRRIKDMLEFINHKRPSLQSSKRWVNPVNIEISNIQTKLDTLCLLHAIMDSENTYKNPVQSSSSCSAPSCSVSFFSVLFDNGLGKKNAADFVAEFNVETPIKHLIRSLEDHFSKGLGGWQTTSFKTILYEKVRLLLPHSQRHIGPASKENAVRLISIMKQLYLNESCFFTAEFHC